MKKLITMGLVAAMLVCMMVVSVSAAPQTVYVYDDFEDDAYSGTVWFWDGSLFATAEEGGYLFGDKNAVVMQGWYENRDPATSIITGGTTAAGGVSTEVDFRIDYAYTADSYIGLWYEITPSISVDDTETQKALTASVSLNPTTGDINVYAGPGMAPQGSEEDGDEGAYLLATGNVGAVAVGEDVDWNKLGMNVSPTGLISAYYNHELVASGQIPNCPANFQSIVVLWNSGCAVNFDNFLSASPDWDLTQVYDPNGGGDDTSADDTSADDTSADDTSADDTSADDTQNPDDTQSPDDSTDPADSQDPADSEEPADTQNGNTTTAPNTDRPNSPQTADTLVLFAVAAIAALGVAVVVKKVSAK